MPTNCVIGLGLSQADWSLSLGATLLYLTNLLGITLSCMLVFLITGYASLRHGRKALRRTIIFTSLLLIPLGGSFIRLVRQAELEALVERVLVCTDTFDRVELIRSDINWVKLKKSGEEVMNNLRRQLSNSLIIRFLLLFAFGWAILQLLTYFETVFVIFTFAAILAALLNYPVRWLQRFLPRTVAVVFVFLISLLIVTALAVTIGLAILSQGQQLINSFLEIANSVGFLLEQLEAFLQERNWQLDLDAIAEQIENFALSGISYILGFVGYSLTNFVNLILIAVVALFMLLNGKKVWKFILKIVPEKSRDRFASTIEEKLLGFFRGQLLLMLFLTISTFLVFILLQAPFPLVLSLIIGIIDAVPGVGATLGIGTVFLILLTQNVVLAFKVLVASIILQQIQDNLISPRVMQNSVNINPVVTFFSLLIGARVAGLLGIFLAVPVAGTIVSLLEIDELKG